jgi:hypothetical protein
MTDLNAVSTEAHATIDTVADETRLALIGCAGATIINPTIAVVVEAVTAWVGSIVM